MVDADATQDPTQLAENPAYRRVVPITSDAGRILAALLGGAVATEAQVSDAAAAGARYVAAVLGLALRAGGHHLRCWLHPNGRNPNGWHRHLF